MTVKISDAIALLRESIVSELNLRGVQLPPMSIAFTEGMGNATVHFGNGRSKSNGFGMIEVAIRQAYEQYRLDWDDRSYASEPRTIDE